MKNECVEHCIEWIKGSKSASVTFPTNSPQANKIRKLAEKSDKVIVISDTNGYLFAHIPVNWVKFNPPRQLSDEYKAVLAERLKKVRMEKTDE